MDGIGSNNGEFSSLVLVLTYFEHVQAEEALAAGEVPVGCIFVRDGKIIAKARNRTNELRNVGERILQHPSWQAVLMRSFKGYSPRRTGSHRCYPRG